MGGLCGGGGAVGVGGLCGRGGSPATSGNSSQQWVLEVLVPTAGRGSQECAALSENQGAPCGTQHQTSQLRNTFRQDQDNSCYSFWHWPGWLVPPWSWPVSMACRPRRGRSLPSPMACGSCLWWQELQQELARSCLKAYASRLGRCCAPHGAVGLRWHGMPLGASTSSGL